MIVATLSLFVLYRVVLDIVGARQFGIWSLVVAATSIVGLSNMGLTGSIVKHVADGSAAEELHRLANMIETTVVSVAVLSLLLSVAGYPLMKAYFETTLPPDAYRSAIDVLPVALVAFCLSMITGIYQSALYGRHLIVQRNGILIFESLSFLALSVGLAPRHGLAGLVYARAIQNLITLLLSVLILKRHLPLLALVPFRWRRDLFKELIGYALSFQFVSLLNMIMDPLTKGLLSRFGSLEMVTYFEMATRLIGQARGVVVNANQVLMPTFAQVNRTDPLQVEVLYRKSYAVIFFVAVCLFGSLAAALPLLALVWLGAEQPVFIGIAGILCLGWLLNTLAVPAYFASLGTGAMRGVVRSHLVMSLANIALGYGFGILWGGYGVVAAWAIALSMGGLVMHIGYCRSIGLDPGSWVPKRGYALLTFCALGLLLGNCALAWVRALDHTGSTSQALRDKLSVDGLLTSGSALLCFAAVFLLPALSNPVRHDLVRWVFGRRAG